MPIHLKVDPDSERVVTTATAPVTSADLISHGRALLELDGRPMAELVDFSDQQRVEVTMDEVRELARLLRDHDINPPGARLALVGSTDAVYGALRVFAAHREIDNVAIQVFRDREAAERWLTAH